MPDLVNSWPSVVHLTGCWCTVYLSLQLCRDKAIRGNRLIDQLSVPEYAARQLFRILREPEQPAAPFSHDICTMRYCWPMRSALVVQTQCTTYAKNECIPNELHMRNMDTTDYSGNTHVWSVTEEPQYPLASDIQNIGVEPLTDDGVVEGQSENVIMKHMKRS
jgi:hypothetical protein